MAAQPKAARTKKAAAHPHVTAKQLAADRANLAKARQVERTKPRTAKQKQAARQNLVKARAAQKSRRAAKKGVAPKKAAAPLPGNLNLSGGLSDASGRTGLPGAFHSLPLCAAVAVAASLQAQAGIAASAEEVWDLYLRTGTAPLGDVIEAAHEHGLAGYRIAAYAPWDPDVRLDGLVYGVQLDIGYHAVLTVPGGMLSWDTVLPLTGEPEEAWCLSWALS